METYEHPHHSVMFSNCYLMNITLLSAVKVMEGMNNSVNPCDNFYQYACGGWIKKYSFIKYGIDEFRIKYYKLLNRLKGKYKWVGFI